MTCWKNAFSIPTDTDRVFVADAWEELMTKDQILKV